ncbi:hypothetical protein J6590_058991 [Homalodisca vitripennis]|nr:hypothetical protein J6590_058991 [Homalodisca vitripennis]
MLDLRTTPSHQKSEAPFVSKIVYIALRQCCPSCDGEDPVSAMFMSLPRYRTTTNRLLCNGCEQSDHTSKPNQ